MSVFVHCNRCGAQEEYPSDRDAPPMVVVCAAHEPFRWPRDPSKYPSDGPWHLCSDCWHDLIDWIGVNPKDEVAV